jgi:hypothetical protein
MRCDAMRCDAMRCDAMRCDAMRCDAMRCDAMRCDGGVPPTDSHQSVRSECPRPTPPLRQAARDLPRERAPRQAHRRAVRAAPRALCPSCALLSEHFPLMSGTCRQSTAPPSAPSPAAPRSIVPSFCRARARHEPQHGRARRGVPSLRAAA